MLSCLRICDLAIIDELELELGAGLNVLTGETGAGKSILVGALELVLGARVPSVGAKSTGARSTGARSTGAKCVGSRSAGHGRALSELVRSGAKSGEVEAAFDVSGDAKLQADLRQLEIEAEGELIVRRVLSACGKSRAFLNGKLVTQQLLARVMRGLADISSQHQHHTLSDPSTHCGYLDAFAGAEPLRQQLSRAYFALCRARAELGAYELRERERSMREAALRAQIAEIEEVAPEPEEDLQLEQVCARLRSSETLLQLTAGAAELLYERDDSVVDALADAGRRMLRAAEIDPMLAPLAGQLEALGSQLSDVARELGMRMRNVRLEPEALQQAEERLHRLTKLKRRHGALAKEDGGGLAAVLAELERSRAELEELGHSEGALERARQEHARLLAETHRAARALSAERRRAAAELGVAISQELASLGMGGAVVHVELTRVPAQAAELAVDGARLTADGLEHAELLIAPDRGEAARPLARVASGGELSRAMLAIKCVLADLGPSGMYVFDEVDTGVGGGMAEVIGRKIHGVARHRQVLCVTHLPQIAVFADHHFKVEKRVADGRTTSLVRRLGKREQSEEIARMLGGLRITAKTRAAARELLREARQAAA